MKTIALLLAGLICLGSRATAAENPHGLPDGLYTEITTERGVVVCELFHQKTPMTVANYVGLAEGTLGPAPRHPFFEGLKWHRVVTNFVVQGGDGGRIGYDFPDECVPGLRHDGIGTLQMANGGPDSNGSQYCLMLSPQQRLNFLHTVFGRVVRGLDVLPKIQPGDTMRVKILRLGAVAQAFRADEAAFNELVAKARRYNGPRQPGPDAPFNDPDTVLPTDIARATHFNFKLANFERFTGIQIAARVFAKAPPGAAGSQLDAYLQGEAGRLGLGPTGALAVYFADEDRWYLWTGPEALAKFCRRGYEGEPLAQALPPGLAAREFLSQVHSRGAEFITKAESAAPPDKPLTPAQKIKFRVDAMLDGLIFKLEPR